VTQGEGCGLLQASRFPHLEKIRRKLW